MAEAGANDDFISEIKDDLERLEPDLLTMEEEGSAVTQDLINHAFRAIHSIKGGAGFCGLKDLGLLSHSMENVLMGIRDGRLEINPEIMDALLHGLDRIKLMIETLDSGMTIAYEDEIQALDNILTTNKKEPKQDLTSILPPTRAENPFLNSKEFKNKKKELQNAVNEGKLIYAVHFDANRDLIKKKRKPADIFSDIETAGDLLFFSLDKDLPETELNKKGQGFNLVMSTILDLEFLAQVLEVPLEEISLLDPANFTQDLSDDFSETVDKKAKKEDSLKKEPSLKQDDGPAIKKKKPPETIRVNVELITRLMNFAGELVLSRNQLRPLVDEYARKDAVMNSVMQNLEMVTSGIQEDIMKIRMQPVGNLLGRFKRIIRDTAKSLSKKVDYTLEGGDVELDRTVLEGLFNPMTHLMRNCVDHGIELPEERKKAGKPETGTISIKAFHQGGNIHINIFDDGMGIDPEKIVSTALKKEIITRAIAEKMTIKEKIDLIFSPGLSTRDTITDVSGRGVGMDVVKTNIEGLRGHIDIDSIPGQGTTVQVIIPLTLAIVSALIVGTDDFKYAIPQANVSEVIFLRSIDFKNNMEKIGDSEVIRLREKLLPVVRLRTLLEVDSFYFDPETGEKHLDMRTKLVDRRSQDQENFTVDLRTEKQERRKNEIEGLYIVVIKVGVNHFGLCVESLFNTEEIVVKPLSNHIKECRCFNGATILGDGRVIMILDASGMANHANLKFAVVNAEEERRKAREKEEHQNEIHGKDVILFSNADNEFFAIELNRMTRLERIAAKTIHMVGHLKYMEYQKESLPLFNLEDLIPVQPCASGLKEMYVIIPKGLSKRCGIIVSNIIDTMAVSQPLQKEKNTPDGVEGTAFVQGRLVQFLDMDTIGIRIDSKDLIPVKENIS